MKVVIGGERGKDNSRLRRGKGKKKKHKGPTPIGGFKAGEETMVTCIQALRKRSIGDLADPRGEKPSFSEGSHTGVGDTGRGEKGTVRENLFSWGICDVHETASGLTYPGREGQCDGIATATFGMLDDVDSTLGKFCVTREKVKGRVEDHLLLTNHGRARGRNSRPWGWGGGAGAQRVVRGEGPVIGKRVKEWKGALHHPQRKQRHRQKKGK